MIVVAEGMQLAHGAEHFPGPGVRNITKTLHDCFIFVHLVIEYLMYVITTEHLF